MPESGTNKNRSPPHGRKQEGCVGQHGSLVEPRCVVPTAQAVALPCSTLGPGQNLAREHSLMLGAHHADDSWVLSCGRASANMLWPTSHGRTMATVMQVGQLQPMHGRLTMACSTVSSEPGDVRSYREQKSEGACGVPSYLPTGHSTELRGCSKDAGPVTKLRWALACGTRSELNEQQGMLTVFTRRLKAALLPSPSITPRAIILRVAHLLSEWLLFHRLGVVKHLRAGSTEASSCSHKINMIR